MIHDASRFEFTRFFASSWREIRDEYTAIADSLVPWMERKLHDGGWDVFGLYDFPHGHPLEANLRRCPRTRDLIERHVPRHGAAGFSVLAPGARIAPHEGWPGSFLRFHLPLIVPAGDCGLRVADTRVRWQEGQPLVFDDRVRHEAWNLTQAPRVILLMDFIPPGEDLAP
jgi:ornithine lipid ester-linked acyl 2-hydroxylase